MKLSLILLSLGSEIVDISSLFCDKIFCSSLAPGIKYNRDVL